MGGYVRIPGGYKLRAYGLEVSLAGGLAGFLWAFKKGTAGGFGGALAGCCR